jgi:hypothetical protein
MGLTDEEEQNKAKRFLYTWRDLFCNDVRDLQPIGLTSQRIPTWQDTIPVRAKENYIYRKKLIGKWKIFQK